MSKNFIKADYQPRVIREAFEKIFHLDRTTLLNQTNIEEEDKEVELDKTFLITTFHPHFKECNKIIHKNWYLLDKSSSTSPLLKLNLTKGNRRAKNLRDILVRAKLPKPLGNSKHSNKNAYKAKNVCNKHNCQYCWMLNTSGRITSVVTRKD